MLVEGVLIGFNGENGVLTCEYARPMGFDDLDNSDWLAFNPFSIIENRVNRCSNVLVFVNGLPLSVIKHKGYWRGKRNA